MTAATWAIWGAGTGLGVVLIIGIYGSIAGQRRLLTGIALGLLFAALLLPFIAYVTAAITHHSAAEVDLVTPPAYLVVTSVTCTLLGGIGLVIGWLAERRRPSQRDASPARPTLPEEDGIDDPGRWLPWRRRDP